MKIFISHSSHDKWVARQISKMLEADKHETFLDEKDITTGDSINKEIQKHLKDSDHLLLLISPASVSSQWVFIELGGAIALDKKVIPVLLHVGSNEIPSVISSLLARDINDLDKYFDEINNPTRTIVVERSVMEKISKKAIAGYSVNDLIQIAQVEHLTDEDKLLSPKWVDGMNKYSGMSSRVTGFSVKGNIYLDIDGGKYKWNTSWLTKIE
jgi:hypothetical protein